MAFSVEQSFQVAQRIATREWRLLLPVVLAFMVLPPLASDLLVAGSIRADIEAAMQSGNPAPVMNAASWLLPLSLVLFLCGTAGTLVVTALAVIPRISVREAIALGLRRLPITVAVLVILFAAMMVIAFTLTLLLVAARVDMTAVQSLLFGILFGMIAVAAARVSVVNALIVTRHIGPVTALRESFGMTQGLFWRLLGAMLVYMIGGIIVTLALTTAVGAVLTIAGRALGATDLAFAMNALFSRLLVGVVGTGLHLLGAAFFLQLGGSSKGI